MPTRALPTFLLLALLGWSPLAAAPDVAQSMVRITTAAQQQDYSVPWNPGNIGQGVGAGFVIEGNRIMTNAHVVSNATSSPWSKKVTPILGPPASSTWPTTAISPS